MTLRCARCNRVLTAEPKIIAGMELGPKCALKVQGHLTARRPRITTASQIKRDDKTPDLFAGVVP